jgi:hypothetical protein
MNRFKSQFTHTIEAQLADVMHTLGNVDTYKILNADNEDPESFDKFTRVIDDSMLKHADDATEIEVQTEWRR